MGDDSKKAMADDSKKMENLKKAMADFSAAMQVPDYNAIRDKIAQNPKVEAQMEMINANPDYTAVQQDRMSAVLRKTVKTAMEADGKKFSDKEVSMVSEAIQYNRDVMMPEKKSQKQQERDSGPSL